MQFKLTAFYAFGFFEIFKVDDPQKYLVQLSRINLIVLSRKLQNKVTRKFIILQLAGLNLWQK